MNASWKPGLLLAGALAVFVGLGIAVSWWNEDAAHVDIENVSHETLTITCVGYGVVTRTYTLAPGEGRRIEVARQESRLDPRNSFEIHVPSGGTTIAAAFKISDIWARPNSRAVIEIAPDRVVIEWRPATNSRR